MPLNPVRQSLSSATLADLCAVVAPVPSDIVMSEVFDRFAAESNLAALAVVDGNIPVGIVCRRLIIERFARPYTRELFGRKPVSAFMQTDPLIIDETADIDDVNRQLIQLQTSRPYDAFIITRDGCYKGLGFARDLVRAITERNQVRLHRLAYFDSLTGLPNRALFIERLREAMERAERDERLVALMLLDLDRFKAINDTFGHFIGDRLLGEVAARLATCVRGGDVVARLGGDEFTVLLPDARHVQDAAIVARKILQRFAEPVVIDGHELHISLSIGISVYPFHDDIADLFRDADTAMYHAKEQGGNRFEFGNAEIYRADAERLQLEGDLRYAVERNELRVYYQPQVDSESGRMIGAEALLRWQHPERGLVSPAQFIPIAEETGLILPIGEWVVRQVCHQLSTWRAAGLLPVRIGINVSAKQLRHSGFVETVRDALMRAGIEPALIQLELTENILIENQPTTVAMLNELHAGGIALALDDFGTGYSSLNYLKRFPIDEVKIDRSFIGEVAQDPEDAAIVTAILAMTHSLGLRTVAEGVETQTQLDFIRARGCQVVQGYLTGKPMPSESFTRLLDRGAARESGGDTADRGGNEAASQIRAVRHRTSG